MCYRNLSKYSLLTLLLILAIPKLIMAGEPNISNEKSFLWEIQSNSTTAYILGSLHFADKTFYPLKNKIEDAFDDSSILVVEINPLVIDEAKMRKAIVERGIYKGSETIQENISDNTFEILSSFLTQNSIPVANVIKMKPTMLAFTLSTIKLMQMGYRPEYGIDMYFSKKSGGEKTIIELETIEEQLTLIFDMPNGDSFLEYTLLDLQQIESLFKNIVKAWKDGDYTAMEKFLFKSYENKPKFKPFLKRIYFDRNIQMVSKIKTLLKGKQKLFFVVASSNLIG